MSNASLIIIRSYKHKDTQNVLNILYSIGRILPSQPTWYTVDFILQTQRYIYSIGCVLPSQPTWYTVDFDNEGIYTAHHAAAWKWPDGLRLIPWKNGKCETWDVTVADTLTQSYLPATTGSSGAAEKKMAKYGQLAQSHTFIPVAAETQGLINNAGLEFHSNCWRHISQMTTTTVSSCSSICES